MQNIPSFRLTSGIKCVTMRLEKYIYVRRKLVDSKQWTVDREGVASREINLSEAVILPDNTRNLYRIIKLIEDLRSKSTNPVHCPLSTKSYPLSKNSKGRTTYERRNAGRNGGRHGKPLRRA